ncbi:hypothetical protein VNO78_14004 [Psophocarpus tetragonolobus]|uniref:GIR1-like zinc ribbon domain-containing protein n=1 Tax=Psophocarpus tetragonolobus TaxID=3891 RepID=A0AAN9SQQ2_PSOTE
MSNKRGREYELSLSPPQTSADQFSTSSSLCLYSSDPDSCVSTEGNDEQIKSMILVGCLRCLMYVLFSKDDPNPKCPKCKSTVLLHFLNHNKHHTNNTTT